MLTSKIKEITTHEPVFFFFTGKQPPQQDQILVLDTNILLSHLDYVKKIISHGLGGAQNYFYA